MKKVEEQEILFLWLPLCFHHFCYDVSPFPPPPPPAPFLPFLVSHPFHHHQLSPSPLPLLPVPVVVGPFSMTRKTKMMINAACHFLLLDRRFSVGSAVSAPVDK